MAFLVMISVAETACAAAFGRLGGDFDGLRPWLGGSAQFVGCGDAAFFICLENWLFRH